MNSIWKTAAASLFIGSALCLSSCGGEYGENTDMPPESTQGNTQETGIQGDGYGIPGDTVEMDTTTDTTTGTTTGTTTETTTGTTAGTTTGTTTSTTTTGTTAGGTTM